MRLRLCAALIAALAAAALACGGESEAPRLQAPARPRAALVLEPPQVPLGGVAEIELVVVTQPDWSVRPPPEPSGLQGFAWIGRDPEELVREPARWLHRVPLRIRSLDVGRFEFPGGSVEVVSPEGEVQSLAYEPLAFEVLSGLSDAPVRDAPFGVRLLPSRAGSPVALVGAFVAGASLSLAALGLLWLLRRRLAEPVETAGAPGASVAPWQQVRDELARARERVAQDPRAALDEASRALRRYVTVRYGGEVQVRTTPELAGARPPFALTTRWPGLVALLAELDAARFPQPPSPERAREEATRLLAAIEAFVADTTPVEFR